VTHHLASFGWPYLLLCALVAVAAGPQLVLLLVRWARFELVGCGGCSVRVPAATS
jgi:hypothetical protein